MERSTTTNLHQSSDDAENTFLTGCDFTKKGWLARMCIFVCWTNNSACCSIMYWYE
jgi:hypothetical protein